MAIGLPLLAKELLEASTRRRTWWVRAGFATAAFIVLSVLAADQAARYDHSLGLLGHGRPIFDGLVGLLLTATLIMAPALGAGCIARERERGTLVLLLLTPMRPLELVVGKWLALQVQLMAPLVAALPLVAVTYAYGGFGADRLLAGLCAPFLAAMLAAAISVAASAFARGTVSAAILGYAGTAVVVLGGAGFDQQGLLLSPLLVPRLELSPLGLFAACSPMLVLILVALLAAAWLLPRRVSVPGTNWWRLYVRFVDAVVGRRLLARARQLQPVASEAPIAWRDRTRRSLTSWPGLMRVLLPVIGGMVAWSAGAILLDEREEGAIGLYVACLCLHGLGWLALLTLGSSLMNDERTGQTLEVLRTTRLTGKDIVQQKVRGLENVFWAMLIAHLVGIAAIAVAAPPVGLAAFFTACAAVFALPPFLYLAVLVGLHVANPMRALATSIGITAGLGLGLMLVTAMLAMAWPLLILLWLSMPVLLVVAAKSLRDRCYARADELLARERAQQAAG